MKKTLQNIYLSLIIFLLYAPIVTLAVLSFNNSKTRAKWGGFTGKWYVSLFQNEQIMNALYTTLLIALLSAFIATLIGTAAAIGIQSMKRKPRTLMMGITNIPMLNADIVTGISLMLLFIAMGTALKFMGIQFSLGFAHGEHYFWPKDYSSAKLAQKRIDKLEKAGIRCKLTGYNGGYIRFIGYTPEAEALLEKERQEYITAHRQWQTKQTVIN